MDKRADGKVRTRMEPRLEGVLVVDKPSGPTSHDIVAKVRKASGIKKVGHTGTLDPMATGVLVLLIGRATRIARFLELEPKEYIAEALFGIKTDTQDITGRVIQESESHVDIEELKRLIPQFTGDILQVPPMVSALKVSGRPLYRLARLGKEIERKERRVTIFKLDLLDFFGVDCKSHAIFRVVCSGGTYVRTLVNDIGDKLGPGATLKSLRRTRVGRYTLSDAISVEEILNDSAMIKRCMISIDNALAHLPEIRVEKGAADFVLNGGIISTDRLQSYPDGLTEQKFVRMKKSTGEILALGRIMITDELRIKPEVVFK